MNRPTGPPRSYYYPPSSRDMAEHQGRYPVYASARVPGENSAQQTRYVGRHHGNGHPHQYQYAPAPPMARAPTYTATHYQWSNHTGAPQERPVSRAPPPERIVAAPKTTTTPVPKTVMQPAPPRPVPIATSTPKEVSRASLTPQVARNHFDCLLYAGMVIKTPNNQSPGVQSTPSVAPTPTPTSNIRRVSSEYYHYDDSVVPDLDLTKSPTPAKPAMTLGKKRSIVPAAGSMLPLRKRVKGGARPNKPAPRKPFQEIRDSIPSADGGPKQQAKGPNTDVERSCRCKNNRCLKLYCECFAGRALCDPASCTCKDCENVDASSDFRREAIARVLRRDKNAFDSRRLTRKEFREAILNGSEESMMCNCPKSKCLKKYCNCFFRGVECSGQCTCRSCENRGVKAALRRAQALAKRKGGKSTKVFAAPPAPLPLEHAVEQYAA